MTGGTLTFIPFMPGWAVAAVVVGLVALLVHGSYVLWRKKVPRRWIAYLAAMRIAAIIIFLICLVRPVWTYTQQVEQRPRVMVLVDTSRSMAASGETDSEAPLRQLVRRARDSDMGTALREQYDVQWFTFDTDARRITAGALDDLSPTGETTHLAQALETAWTYCRQLPGGTPTHALVLSDGRDPGASEAVDAAKRMGLSLHALPPGDAQPGAGAARVRIAGVSQPRQVLLGSNARLHVRVESSAAVDEPLTLELLEADEVVARQAVSFASGEGERVVEMSHQPTRPGPKQYALRLTATDEAAVRVDQPPYELTVNVLSRQNEVLFIEDTWRWSFKFLKRVFEDDPSFTFTAFLARGAGIYQQFAEPDRSVKLGGFPRSKAELAWFDIIILGDVQPRRWPGALAPAIHDLVVEEGKSLIVIAGPNVAQLAAEPLIERLLPVQITGDSAQPVPGPIDVRLTEGGAASAFFFRASDGQSSTSIFRDLPAMEHIYAPQRKQPAATILLDAPDLTNQYGPLIVLAEHTVGRGRVLYVGTDTLWKWQLLGTADAAGNTPYTLFWQQTLRAMAPSRSTGGEVHLALLPDRTRYRIGQGVDLVVDVQADRPIAQAQLEATVTLPDGRVAPVALDADPGQANRFHARFEAAQPGAYRIAAAARSEGRTVADAVTTVDVAAAAPESPGEGADLATLAHITGGTGGSLVDVDDRATWVPEPRTEAVTFTRKRTIDLWNSYVLLLLLIAVLGMDWAVRLLRGFV